MCGISGIIYSEQNRPVDPSLLKAMGDAIAHRGPDAEGYWIEPGIGLVHRRLSIIDLEGGKQPIGNEDGSIQVVFNGEIYNYQSLRRGLEAQGHRFRTNSDTEVLVHLYEEMGDRLVERLRGMFAFALWDRTKRRLFLARDRLGLKPLYIYRDAEMLLFGSELKAILAYPGVDRQVDPAAIECYLALGMVAGDRSIFRQIEKLKPAHVLSVDHDQLSRVPRRYWQLRIEPDDRLTVDDWQEAIRHKLEETTRLHLIADVPVGAFLSGGIDSSIIVALSAGATQGPLQTFSIGFAEERYSELPYAREIANRFGTRHSEQIVTPDAASLVDELTRYYDEPFADSSAIPTYLVSRLASKHVKVVLSGDGGDEAFGGYSRYTHDLKEAALRRRLPGWLRRSVLKHLAQVWPKADWLPRPLRAKTMLTNLSLAPGPAYANTLTLCRPPLRRLLIGPELRYQLNGNDPGQPIWESFSRASSADPLAGMIAADTDVILPDDFLVKVDRASMAHGLEVRPPLVDHELMELAARIPSRWKVHNGETKWILKQAFQGRPSGGRSLERTSKALRSPSMPGFAARLRPMFESAVLDPKCSSPGLIDQKVATAASTALISAAPAAWGTCSGASWCLASWSESICPWAWADQ